MRRRTNPSRVTEPVVRGSNNDVLNRIADRALDMIDTLLNTTILMPYSPVPYGHIPGLYESLHGDLCAQGDMAVTELLRRHAGAGGASAPEVLAVVQMAGRYGARVYAAPPGNALSVQFPGPPGDRVLAMLAASGMQRVVGEGSWLWSEDPATAGNLLGG
jgi:hypothetical protein